MNQDHSVIFEVAPKHYISDSFALMLDLRATSLEAAQSGTFLWASQVAGYSSNRIRTLVQLCCCPTATTWDPLMVNT